MPQLEVQSNPDSRPSQKMLSPFLRIALLLGVCVHLLGFLVFRVISTPLPTREATPPFVRYVSPDSLVSGAELEEQAVLFDSAPLFIPGQWNAAHNLEPPMRDRASMRFPSYEPDIDVASALVPDSFSLGQAYGVAAPVDLLAFRYWDLFRGFAGALSAPVELEDPGVFAEIRALDGSLLETLTVEVEALSTQAVQPSTYYLRVESGGRALGRPTLASSSGDTSFDAAVYSWLADSKISSRLPAGFFEIRIYP